MWKANSFTYDKVHTNTAFEGFKQQELIALAFLKHQRDYVIKKKFSMMASFDGRHRSGKSITACLFAYLWDDTFWKYFEHRIVQDHKEFNDAIENIAKGKGIKGAVIMVDEAGVSMSSSDWYERWMKNLTKIFQMFGYLHPIVLFVAPVKDFVDSRLRKMFHNYYKIDRYDNKMCWVTPYDVKYNTVRSKWYYKKPLVRIGGQEIQIRRLGITKPPDFLLERYAELEVGRKTKLLEKLMSSKENEKQQTHDDTPIEEFITHVIENFHLFESTRSKASAPIADANTITYTLNVPQRKALVIKSIVERRIKEKYREEILRLEDVPKKEGKAKK